MSQKVAIDIKEVSKVFHLQYTDHGLSGEHKNQITALDSISLKILKGEVIGITGPNGSGKSTLLKILAGITKPTSGEIIINGRLASILDIGAGFHPELTGRENVYLNGQLLGFSKNEIKKKYDSIIAFSGIGNFINEPVKNYSNGMYLRLAFSIIIHLDCDVLLLDEVLAVGDHEFMKKCLDAIRQKKEMGITVVIVSHNKELLSYLCTRQIVISHSKLENSKNNFFDIETSYEADHKIMLKKINSEIINDYLMFDLMLSDVKGYEEVDIGLLFDSEEQLHSRFIISSVHNFSTGSSEETEVSETIHFKSKIPLINIKPGKYNISVYIIKNRLTITRLYSDCHICEITAGKKEDFLLNFYPNPLRLFVDWEKDPIN